MAVPFRKTKMVRAQCYSCQVWLIMDWDLALTCLVVRCPACGTNLDVADLRPQLLPEGQASLPAYPPVAYPQPQPPPEGQVTSITEMRNAEWRTIPPSIGELYMAERRLAEMRKLEDEAIARLEDRRRSFQEAQGESKKEHEKPQPEPPPASWRRVILDE